MDQADQSPGRRILGAMCGTSLDGLDVVSVATRGCGLDVEVIVEDLHHVELGALRDPLRRAAAQEAMSCRELAELGHALGVLHAEAFAELVLPDEPVDLAVAHGQTVYHAPPISWQLLDPAPIAATLGVPVIWDIRRGDLAAGGQGAPITPLADWIFYRHPERRRAIVNLGGFCNVTLLPTAEGALDDIRGFDVCACNHVLDAIARETTGEPYDADGTASLNGAPDDALTADLTERLAAQSTAERSLGTGDELIDWVVTHRTALWPPDLAATAATALGTVIAQRLGDVDELILAGGGAFNRGLVRAIEDAATIPVTQSEDEGIPVTAREPAAIAVLGLLATEGIPITLPQVTGRARGATRTGGPGYSRIDPPHTPPTH